jgi:hypothetical protein
MYVESSPVTARRSTETPRRRGGCPMPTARRPQPEIAAARRSRVDDAIVAQWLLDQLPAEHRHAFGSATHR